MILFSGSYGEWEYQQDRLGAQVSRRDDKHDRKGPGLGPRIMGNCRYVSGILGEPPE